MAKITPEDKAQLKQFIKTLKANNAELAQSYKMIMRKLWLQYAYLILWIVSIVFMQLYLKNLYGAIIIFVESCMFFLILSVNHKISLKHRKTYKEALLTFDGLLKLVDWEAYRKRQLYQDTDERVEEAIDGFLRHARKRVSPAYSNVFDALLLAQMLIRYVIYVWAVVILYRELINVIHGI